MFGFLKGRLVLVRICLLACALALVGIGIITIYAVGHPKEPGPSSNNINAYAGLYKKQILFTLIGLIGFIAVNNINYRYIGRCSYWIFTVVIFLLIILLLSKYVYELPFAKGIRATYRWIQLDIGGLWLSSIQPSEFCKLAYIVALAWYLRYRSNYRSFKALIGPFLLTLLPMALILPEPDLGTVMLMMPILFIMLFMAGARPKHLLMVIMMAVIVSPLLWFKMHSYQRTRITSVFLQHPAIRQATEENRWLRRILAGENFSGKEWMNGDGFNLIRAKYAIASGGLTGHGFRQGPFIKYNFLPERHNDFIFAMVAHQWGFIGCIVIMGLYLLIILCGVEIALYNTDPFGRLISISIVAMFMVEVFVHIGMAIGIMPITGLTLPLMSYGGSSMVVNMLAIGLLHNVGRCRPFSVAQRT